MFWEILQNKLKCVLKFKPDLGMDQNIPAKYTSIMPILRLESFYFWPNRVSFFSNTCALKWPCLFNSSHRQLEQMCSPFDFNFRSNLNTFIRYHWRFEFQLSHAVLFCYFKNVLNMVKSKILPYKFTYLIMVK